MEILVILNDPPWDERSYIGLRVFLIGDAASRSAKKEQKVPRLLHNVQLMLADVHAGAIGACGICMDA